MVRITIHLCGKYGVNMNDEKEKYTADDYRETSFLVIDDEDSSKVIHDFCDAVFAQQLPSENDKNEDVKEQHDAEELILSGKEFLAHFIIDLPKPITIVQEVYHIDRSFRDTYYMYFSNQHFQVERYSRRLSFFFGSYGRKKFLGNSSKIQTELENNFIGCCVINPLVAGGLGRTLINPKYVLPKKELPVYMRLSDFCVHIYGRTLKVRAFPYRMQDQETMRCAEVTLMNILEYYSNGYNDYKSALPSEIIEGCHRHSDGSDIQLHFRFEETGCKYVTCCVDNSSCGDCNCMGVKEKSKIYCRDDTVCGFNRSVAYIVYISSGYCKECIGRGNRKKSV